MSCLTADHGDFVLENVISVASLIQSQDSGTRQTLKRRGDHQLPPRERLYDGDDTGDVSGVVYS